VKQKLFDRHMVVLSYFVLVTVSASILHNVTKDFTHAYTFQYIADASIVAGAIYLCYNYYKLYKNKSQEKNIYLYFAAAVMCIATVHLLRMFYRGIPC
jgi:TRAP-type uncharacterized transport system fused permease subunit